MITRVGWATVLTSLAGLLLGALFVNYLLVLVALLAFVFLSTEVLAFHLRGSAVVPAEFRVRRAPGFERIALGGEASERVEIAYLGRTPFWGEAIDVVPDRITLLEGTPRVSGWWTPGTFRAIEYRYRATERGSSEVGPTILTARGALALTARRAVLATQRPLKVTPENPVVKPGQIGLALYTRVQGRLALRHRGYGTEFRSLRPYQTTDDVRHIAWKRSTPTQWMTREFDQESRQDFLLVLDVSEPMLVGRRGETALDRAVEAATLVTGFVARSAEDRVGLTTYADSVRQYLRPQRGQRHFRQLADNLAFVTARPGEFGIARLLDAIALRLRQNTHVLVFSALRGPLDGLEAARARFLSRGHHLYMFLPSPAGFYPTVDDAPGQRVFAWAASIEQRRVDGLASVLRSQGVPVFVYDRRGAATSVISAYSTIRAWGIAT